jgi:hypothetical protein
MPAQMTSTAWGRGIKNALVVATAMLVVWCIITAAVVLIFEQPVFRSFGVSGAALIVLTQVLFFGTWFYQRSVAGSLLLDCGPHPTRWFLLLTAVLFGFLGLTNGLEHILRLVDGPEATWVTILFAIGWPVIMISLVPYWLVMAGGRLQARENGIWQYWGLLRLGKIASYDWANDATLLIRAKGFFSSFLQGVLPVPPEQKQAVEELLAKHCPAQANA